jgi:signal transduction histidine kinase
LMGVLGATVATAGMGIYWVLTQGVDAFALTGFASLNVIIVLAGVMGNTQTIVVITIASNILSLFLFLLTPVVTPNLTHQLSLFAPQVYMQQWLTAILMIVSIQNYQRNLRELSNARIQYERARQVDDLKDQFIRSVNHELRTPVMALQGFIELYLEGKQLPPERRHRLIEDAGSVCDDLVHLMESILETGRIDQGAKDFTPQTVFVLDAIKTATRLVDPREGNIVERELRVHVPEDLAIMGESVRLQQIFSNLLSNAVKYSVPGTSVEITATRLPLSRSQARTGVLEQPKIRITVRDYGLGIPEDKIPLLFQRFVRLPRDLASRITGNGLGLYLCRVFTEAMGGTITVESTGVPGEGSTFILILPLAIKVQSVEVPQEHLVSLHSSYKEL